jgi:hypothetical protein
MKFSSTLLTLTLLCVPTIGIAQQSPPPPNVWRVELSDWVDNSLHWNSPSYIDLNLNDGSLVFFATHIANMRREGFLDQGVMRRLVLTLEFFDDADCKGQRIGVDTRIVLPGIGYKREYDNYLRAFGGTPEKARLYTEAQCVLAGRSWE